MELEEQICKLIANVFILPIEKIDIDSSNENVEEWDSLGQLQVIMAIEKEFGIRFKTDEISKLSSVRELLVKTKSLL